MRVTATGRAWSRVTGHKQPAHTGPAVPAALNHTRPGTSGDIGPPRQVGQPFSRLVVRCRPPAGGFWEPGTNFCLATQADAGHQGAGWEPQREDASQVCHQHLPDRRTLVASGGKGRGQGGRVTQLRQKAENDSNSPVPCSTTCCFLGLKFILRTSVKFLG